MCAEAGCAASGARGVSKRLLVPTGVFTGFQLPCCNVFVSDGNSRTADAMISRGVADARGRSAESLQSRCRQSARPVSSLAPALLSPALLSPAPLFPTMTSPRRSPPFACLALSAALDAPSRHPAGVARSTGGSPGPPPLGGHSLHQSIKVKVGRLRPHALAAPHIVLAHSCSRRVLA